MVYKIIIIQSFRVGTSISKNVDHWGKENCVYAWFANSKKTAINVLLPFLFEFFKLKEKDYIGIKINGKKKFMWKISYIIFLICWKLGSDGSVQQKIKLHSTK